MWDELDGPYEVDPNYMGTGRHLIIKERFAYFPLRIQGRWVWWKKFTDIIVKEDAFMYDEAATYRHMFRFTEEEYMVWKLTLDKPVVDHIKELLL